MTAVLCLLAAPVLMWLGQTILLLRHGLPVRWRLDASDAPRDVRTGGRVVTQVALLAVIVAYPLLIGRMPVEYHRSLLPVQIIWMHTLIRSCYGGP